MLNLNNRYDTHAYRVAGDFRFGSAMKEMDTIAEGTWVSVDTDGTLKVADGTGKAFILLTSKRPGRDYVTGAGEDPLASVLMGVAILDTDQIDTSGVTPGAALSVGTGGSAGKLVKQSGSAAVVAYALSAPDASTGLTRIYILP